MRGHVTVGNAATEHPQVFLGAGSSHIEDRYVPRRARRGKLRIVVQKLVQTVHDVHAEFHRFKHKAPFVWRQHAARRCHAIDVEIGYTACVRQCVRKVAKDRDPVRLVAEHRAGIETGLLAVDDREDLVRLRVTDKSVGRLAVEGAEVPFAIDNRGRASFLCADSWPRGHHRIRVGGIVVIAGTEMRKHRMRDFDHLSLLEWAQRRRRDRAG